MSRFRYGSRLAVTLAGMVLLASACGGGEATMQSAQSADAPAAERKAVAQDGGTASSARVPRAQRSAAASAGTAGQQVTVVPQDRAIIYTAEMTVRAKDVTAAADKARQVVAGAGGYLAMEKSDAYSGGEGSAQLVFKVPPQGYPAVLDRLGKELGTRESLQQNTEDVTEQVADVESRLRSAKTALDSLRTLMKKADTIGQVLDVEREISGREADLESLQARQKSLASQTSLATLTLNLVGPAAVVPEPEEEPSGFLSGLRSGWKGFVTAVKIGLTVLGALLPWMIVIVPLGWVVLRLGRTRRGTSRTAPAPFTLEPFTPDPDPDGPGQAADDPGQEPAPSERS